MERGGTLAFGFSWDILCKREGCTLAYYKVKTCLQALLVSMLAN